MLTPLSGAAAMPQAVSQPQPATQPAAQRAAQGTQAASASLTNDTVSISPKGQAAAASGDVDHDGDSH